VSVVQSVIETVTIENTTTIAIVILKVERITAIVLIQTLLGNRKMNAAVTRLLAEVLKVVTKTKMTTIGSTVRTKEISRHLHLYRRKNKSVCYDWLKPGF